MLPLAHGPRVLAQRWQSAKWARNCWRAWLSLHLQIAMLRALCPPARWYCSVGDAVEEDDTGVAWRSTCGPGPGRRRCVDTRFHDADTLAIGTDWVALAPRLSMFAFL